MVISEKILVCYHPCGPTFRKSVYDHLVKHYVDDDNVYYFILTDDKDYFKDVPRKNVIAKNLKDFYERFPEIEPYERYLESTDQNDYAQKYYEQNFLFPFTVLRFCYLQAIDMGITNVAIMCTDTKVDFAVIESLLHTKHFFHGAINRWFEPKTDPLIADVVEWINSKGLQVSDEVPVWDSAGKLFLSRSIEDMKHFFNLWHELCMYLWETGKMNKYPHKGHYVIHDEHIVSPLYNVVGFDMWLSYQHSQPHIFHVHHNPDKERWWNSPNPKYKLSTNFEEFLAINNITEADLDRWPS